MLFKFEQAMKKIIILVTIVLTGALSASAQHFFSVQYSMGFGSGNSKTYVNSSSFRGINIDYRKMVNDNVGVGFEAGWNVFYERRAYDTYTQGVVSLSGVQYRYMDMVPLLFSGSYYFKPGEHVNPFLGMGAGTLYTNRYTSMGLYALSADAWMFSLRPEAGVLINVNPGLDIILAGKYYYGFANSDFKEQSYFTFNVGFAFREQ